MRETFAEISQGDPLCVYNAFDIIGDIAIFRLPPFSVAKAANVAEAIMNRHNNVKTVFIQTGAVTGDFRLRSLKYVAGEKSTRTIHKEHGCSFAVDVESCYFSPRLLNERMRIAKLVQPSEVIVNMFAGVGCFSIIIARYAQAEKVFSIDMNPIAVKFMKENIRRNRVFDTVIPIQGEARATIDAFLERNADRILLLLPGKALEYMSCALSSLKASGGWIHIHTFSYAAKTVDPKEKTRQVVTEMLGTFGVDYIIPCVRVVRSTGPNWYQLVADIQIKQFYV